MRRAALVALLVLAGCEKSFEDRYADTEKKIREQAASIDKDLAVTASEAALARESERSAAEANAAIPASKN